MIRVVFPGARNFRLTAGRRGRARAECCARKSRRMLRDFGTLQHSGAILTVTADLAQY